MKRFIYNIRFYLGWLVYHRATLNKRRYHLKKLSNLEYSEREYFTYNEYKREYYDFIDRCNELNKLKEKIDKYKEKEKLSMIDGHSKTQQLLKKQRELQHVRNELRLLRAKNNSDT
tara:strand:+ start:356 stop:703 length:348 start_codon:yes stop_codon:yes gene_type:complete